MADHNHCDHHEGCGHDHLGHDLGPEDNLFSQIDRANVVALNGVQDGANVIKPWSERLDQTKFLESDADDQIILRIPFTGSIRLRSLLIKAGPGDQTPSKIVLYANQPNLDFDEVNERTPSQEFELPQSNEVGEYPLKAVKFSNLSSVTLFIPAAQGAEASKIYYVGFLGTWSKRNENPVITVYETQANLADHPKIQGMDGAHSSLGQ
ncbi:hypothetical protein EST38_g8016 [Candolleomyces aberdarensis]|uniref:PITH domain-containing protein n=1 Tax=Candolleomyces aberdarensis TaxID=2316362 RepID=A0A4Q2DGG8_9AGAR|nr:hypothetical protein EST38_g8016 [Candolleomyces aberdarensis]